ncbi:MAG TPA: ectoine hydroxylase [Citreicella sp.]|jgi:ectoine hydroxylase|uniref:Ectoine hydroxylase n=1 Tax=Salipiger marinus TaxID=555512 RepID=A0A1G8PF50_9RHOB|nr:ectoine hydroxylase [Salipiger marinus]SDI90380.1 ectoine hydroxylase [Salipiger marinus]HBM61565.1 ectoine hydroxylase [Citreicella sp.]HBS98965.1 ectoine hydroxylase [Citreicella sp.]
MNVTTGPAQFTDPDAYPTRLPDAERMTARRDPVLWSDWTDKAPVSREEAEFYAEKGYLVRRDLFTPEEVRLLIDTSAKLRANGQQIRSEDLVTEPGSDAVRTVFRLDEHDALFARLAADSRVADVARFLLGDEVYLHQSRLNYKPGFTGKEFYWHSDFETWHAEDGMPRMRAVSASVLLTDNSALNGPLMLIPGSHGRFIACQGETPEANHESSLKKQEVGVPSQAVLEQLAAEAGIDAATGPAGTVIFFECNTLHASNGNVTPFPRSNAFFVYNAVSNQPKAPFAASAPRPAFLAHRGEASPLRVVSGDLCRG